MHVLITTDTVGGVWTYTQELVKALLGRGNRVTLMSFGRLPKPDQILWAEGLADLDYRPTDYRLEWMEVAQRDVEESRSYLEMVVREVQPDILHLNQYCYSDVAPGIPRVVVAHSDVVSWWVAVHGREPDESPWIRWYRETVTRGLDYTDVVVAPSQWMLDQVRTYYTSPRAAQVIYNGRDPDLFEAASPKENFVLTAGRLWDEGKQVSLLLKREQAVPCYVAGSFDHPHRTDSGSEKSASTNVHFIGEQSQQQMRQLLSRAAIYAATSCYEPFGLAPLEAALSRCALVANDTPTFHEIWGDAAIYFRRNDPDDLAVVIRKLADDEGLRRRCGNRAYERACERYTTEKTVYQYEHIYENVMSLARVA
ncbi:MAG: glycosyl transferase, group 1 [Acidobacteriaceae bacterium]|jgi:glycogen(starch) synthase|nr:glycosyl transferase, group 1 [Acidobacteriaceae bacterium]